MDLPDKSGIPKVGPTGPSAPREKKAPIVSGVVKVKRPITRRLFGFLLAESPKAAAARIGQDVLLPQMKMGLEAAVHAFVSNLFWANSANRPMSGMVQRPTLLGNRTPYNILSSNPHQQQQIVQAAAPQQSSGNYEDLVCPTVAKAQELLATMLHYLTEYPVVAVADLYEWADITPTTSDNAFGWSDISEARIVPGRGGFILELPRPTLL